MKKEVKQSNSISYLYNFNKPEEGVLISIGDSKSLKNDRLSKMNIKAEYHLDTAGVRVLYDILSKLIENMK